MVRLSQEVNRDYVLDVLTEDIDIDELIKIMENKGRELGHDVISLEALEGESDKQGNLYVLKSCPMVGTLNDVKAHEGGQLPAHFQKIVDAFKEKHPTRAAILHPLCIIHQVIRATYGQEHGQYFEQVACRSGDSGAVVVAQDGLVMSGLDEDKAKSMVDGKACLYYLA